MCAHSYRSCKVCFCVLILIDSIKSVYVSSGSNGDEGGMHQVILNINLRDKMCHIIMSSKDYVEEKKKHHCAHLCPNIELVPTEY